MASERNQIEWVFSVDDRGSSVVEESRKSLRGYESDAERLNNSFTRTGQGATTLAQTFNQTGRQARLLAGDVISELNPALGGIVTRATQAGGAVGGLGIAATATVAALVIASAALTQYVRNLNETAERQARLNIAVKSFDAGAIRSQLADASLELEKFDRRNQTVFGNLQNRFAVAAERFGLGTTPGTRRSEAAAELSRLAPYERERGSAEIRVGELQAREGVTATQFALAQQRGDLSGIIAANEQLLRLYQQQATAEERLLITEQQREVSAARTRGESAENVSAIERRFYGLRGNIGERYLAREAAANLTTRNAFFSTFSSELQRDVEGAPGGYAEQAGVGPTSQEQTAGFQRNREEAIQELQIRTQILQVESQVYGLTRSEQATRQLLVVEAERQLRFAAALGDADKERAANLEAQARAASLVREQLERTDATAGIAAGFRDVADQVQSAGQRMREGIVNTFHEINRSFGDVVVAGISGQGSKLGEIGRQLGLNLLRSFVNEFSTRAIGGVFNAISGYAPSARSVVGTVGAAAIAGSAIAPATAGAGTLLPYGAGIGRVTATGTIQPVASTAGSVAYGQGGDAVASGGGVNLPVTGLARLLPTGGESGGFASGFFGPSVSLYDAAVAYGSGGFEAVAALQAGNAVIVNGELVYTAGAAYGGGAAAAGALEGGGAAAAGAQGASSAAGLGATVASVAGGVLAAAALVYGAYSAYQAGAAGDKYAALSGAASGAVSGAVLGSIIYPGIGTVVGAIAGAAIGAGAGGAGKASAGQSHAAREAKETQNVENSVSGFSSAVAGAEDMVALWGVLLDYSHAAYGGGKAGVSPETSGFAFVFTFEEQQYIVGTRDAWGGRHPYLKLATLEIFKAWGLGGDPGTFQAAIQAGIAGKDAINGPATQIVQQKVQSLREQELRGLIAYQEGFDAVGVSGTAVSRLTVLPASRAREADGKNLLFSRDELVLAGFTDDMIESFIRRMAKVSFDRNLGAIDAPHLIF